MKIETLKDYVQSANINFLIGSGLSRPFLPTLGNIENQLAELNDLPQDKRTAVKATLYQEYFNRVIKPNLHNKKNSEEYLKTLENYIIFLSTWNTIIHNRRSSLRSKQVNLFSTNIDLCVEKAVELTEVEFNDGFIGSVNPVFNEANFQKTVRKESIHFQNSSELPAFNLLKMHGSVNWKDDGGKIVNDYGLTLIRNTSHVLRGYDKNDFPEYSSNIHEIAKRVEKSIDFSDFFDAYQRFQIVNPTKEKFSQTVLDVHFYELMRVFSNNLEKENTILFVMGFSFADEHIRNIVQRALKTNPTLLVIIFSYSDAEVTSFQKHLKDNTGNLLVLSPTAFNDENGLLIEHFDFESINKVFKMLLQLIPTQFANE